MRKHMEMQGFETVPADAEDEIWLRDGEGEFVKQEVQDDASDAPA